MKRILTLTPRAEVEEVVLSLREDSSPDSSAILYLVTPDKREIPVVSIRLDMEGKLMIGSWSPGTIGGDYIRKANDGRIYDFFRGEPK